MKTRFYALPALLLSLLLILSGCVDRDRLKEDVREAVRKHAEIHNYRFSGTLEHTKQPSTPAEGLLLLFPGGEWPAEVTVTWQGAASVEPLRAEAEIRILAPGREPAVIPLVIQNTKMYFRLPGLPSGDTFFVADLDELAGRNTEGKTPSLGQAGMLFASLADAFVGAMDVNRFDGPEDKDGGKRITAVFTEKESKAFGEFWSEAWPSVLAALSDSGYLTNVQPGFSGGDAVTGPSGTEYVLEQPARFTFDLTEDGYLEQFRAEVNVSWQSEDGSAGSRVLRLTHRNDDINKGQRFYMEVPGDAIPFDELLKRLPGAPGMPSPEN